jgi:hypothetical protein
VSTRYAVQTAGGRRVRLYTVRPPGEPPRPIALDFVTPREWHTTYTDQRDAQVIADELNADNPARGARVVPI